MDKTLKVVLKVLGLNRALLSQCASAEEVAKLVREAVRRKAKTMEWEE